MNTLPGTDGLKGRGTVVRVSSRQLTKGWSDLNTATKVTAFTGKFRGGREDTT